VIRGLDAAERLSLSSNEPLAGLSAFRRDGELHLDLFWTSGGGAGQADGTGQADGDGQEVGLGLASSILDTFEGPNRSFRDLYGDTYLFAPDTPPVSMALGELPVQPTEARRAPDYLSRILPLVGAAFMVGFVLLALAWLRRRRIASVES
jgi:hypothetical protein